MSPRTLLCTLATLLVLTPLSGSAAKDLRKAPWGKIKKASKAQAESIGGYSNGCVEGALELAAEGPGFRSVRRFRHRFFGHPRLIEFLENYGEGILAAGLEPVLVGDLSQPRGGPMPYGHKSHQIGLDADIWFTRPTGKKLKFVSLVDHEREKVRGDRWRQEHVEMLRLAAQSPGVARVFVNAAIKGELCSSLTGDRSWLNKIRPWWGHDEHFHVRLACPDGNDACQGQGAVGVGDGCGQVAWFSRAAVEARKKAETKPVKPKRKPPIPKRCAKLLDTK